MRNEYSQRPYVVNRSCRKFLGTQVRTKLQLQCAVQTPWMSYA